MAAIGQAARVTALAERLLENPYARENLREAADRLRAAQRRASKRRVNPAEDRKLRRQAREAAESIREAADALTSGRQKPKKGWRRRLLVVLGLGGLGAAVALAASEDLRRKLLGDDSVPQRSDDATTEAAESEAVPA